MSTLIVAGIMIGFILSISLLLIHIAKKQKRKRLSKLLNRFRDLAIQNDLSFSSQELLSDVMIGIDGLKKKLLIIDGINDQSFGEFVIDLNKITRCAVRKNYRIMNYQKLKTPEAHLQNIMLSFGFGDNDELYSIPFYKNTNDHEQEIPQLELKARHWETMIAKMIVPVRTEA